MKRQIALAGVVTALAIGYLVVPASVLAQVGAMMGKGEGNLSEPLRSTNGRLQVYPRSADGGMAEVIALAPDGGLPVALPAGESAGDPLFCAPVAAGAAIGAANPLPADVLTLPAGELPADPLYQVQVVGAAAASTANPAPVAISLGGAAASGANPLPATLSSGPGTAALTPAYVRGTADDGSAHDGTGVVSSGVDSASLKKPVLIDSDRRQVVSVGTVAGTCLGADLTTASGNGPTLATGTEYRVCALTDLWISWAGGAAAADAPSEPLFARGCVTRGPFSAETTPTAILPSGASVLSGKEIIACPVARAAVVE